MEVMLNHRELEALEWALTKGRGFPVDIKYACSKIKNKHERIEMEM